MDLLNRVVSMREKLFMSHISLYVHGVSEISRTYVLPFDDLCIQRMTERNRAALIDLGQKYGSQIEVDEKHRRLFITLDLLYSRMSFEASKAVEDAFKVRPPVLH